MPIPKIALDLGDRVRGGVSLEVLLSHGQKNPEDTPDQQAAVAFTVSPLYRAEGTRRFGCGQKSVKTELTSNDNP